MDESLTFKEYRMTRIKKVQAMLAQFNSIGNSQWGIRVTSWRQIYMEIIRAMALLCSKLGWRGQRDCKREFEQLQYQALKKCINATYGSKIGLVSQITGVESSRMALDAAQARLIGKMNWDTTTLEDLIFQGNKERNAEGGRE